MTLSRDVVLGVLAVVLASAYYAGATGIQESLLADAVGADGIPRAIGIGMGVVGAALALRGALRPSPPDDDAPPLNHYVRAALLLGILILYLVAIPWLGYPIAVALLIAAVARFAGARANATLAVTAIVGAALFWFMFSYLLGIPMPTGILSWA